jgi:Domain of Unknown Function (DUF1080)
MVEKSSTGNRSSSRDANYHQYRQALLYRSDRCSLGADSADVAGNSTRWSRPALFPTLSLANPSLAALRLALRTAKAILKQSVPVEPGLRTLGSGGLAGWQMAGFGGFMELGANIIETIDGIGLLWHTPEQFENSILRVDWRASFPDDNSGVFIRFPALGNTDPANDWKPAVDQGYEIQIDDTGKNPELNPNVFNDSLHRTGAVYKLAPANILASLPIGQWNAYEIEANGNDIKATINGQFVSHLQNGNRLPKGFIGLQNHHFEQSGESVCQRRKYL